MPAFIMPTSGRVSSGYGTPRTGHTHQGLDLAAPAGTPVVASAAGRVTHAGALGTAGLAVVIEHGNAQTKYFHLSRVLVSVGQSVMQGQGIGLVGATGNASGAHLHFEIWTGGQSFDPQAVLNGSINIQPTLYTAPAYDVSTATRPRTVGDPAPMDVGDISSVTRPRYVNPPAPSGVGVEVLLLVGLAAYLAFR